TNSSSVPDARLMVTGFAASFIRWIEGAGRPETRARHRRDDRNPEVRQTGAAAVDRRGDLALHRSDQGLESHRFADWAHSRPVPSRGLASPEDCDATSVE